MIYPVSSNFFGKIRMVLWIEDKNSLQYSLIRTTQTSKYIRNDIFLDENNYFIKTASYLNY